MVENIFAIQEGMGSTTFILAEDLKMFSDTVVLMKLIFILLVGTKIASKMTYYWGGTGVALGVVFMLVICFFSLVGLSWASRIHKNKAHRKFFSISFKVATGYILFLIQVLGSILGTIVSQSLFLGDVDDVHIFTYLINVLVIGLFLTTIQLVFDWAADFIRNYTLLISSQKKENVD